MRHNHLGQPLGAPLPAWQSPPAPAGATMQGQYCRLEPVTPDAHADDLFAAYSEDRDGAIWTYLPYGPFASSGEYRAWMEQKCLGDDPRFFTLIELAGGRASGLAAYLRIDRRNGVIEVGHLAFAPRLQRTRAATEALYLMMRYAFELGYRRCEWKCDVLNAPSHTAARRLGFTYEGTFRQAVVVKGRNRDTAWFSVLDTEWPALRLAYERWLDPGNFAMDGRQRSRLSDLTAGLGRASG